MSVFKQVNTDLQELSTKQENLLSRLKVDLQKKTQQIKDYEKLIAKHEYTIESQQMQIDNAQ